MNILLKTLAVTTALAGALQSPASATSGALDFLDPCIKARSDFAEQRQTYFANVKLAENSIETMKATPEFRTAWMAEVRKQARPLFDEKLVPSLRAMGVVDFEKAFEVWFEMEMQAAKPEDLESRINADFRSLAKGELNKQRTEADQKLNEGKDQLDGSCKKDVGSQTLRLTLAPIGWVVGNFEASKNEKNIVTQVFHAVTGIGVQAIAERGILGGDKSFVRTALEPVIGGRNGAIQRGVGDVARAFKPGNWRF